MKQMLLFPDPRPLVERLGRSFFLAAPQTPGVYLMRDKGDTVLYVGKAVNLRKRLASYRVANPDRMPRRHLQMLRQVDSISFESCADELAALRRESELLLALKPRFNRAGTWAGPRYNLLWRAAKSRLEFKMQEEELPGWDTLCVLGKGKGARVLASLSRLLWCVLNPERCFTDLPAGWLRERFMDDVCGVSCMNEGIERAILVFRGACEGGEPGSLCDWLREHCASRVAGYERAILDADLENLERLFGPGKRASINEAEIKSKPVAS